MSKTQSENTLQNDSIDSSSITFKIGGLISRLKHLQEIGDITMVSTPIKELDYSKALKEYEELNKIAKKTTQFSSPADQAAFLFNLNKCQAIIDFRVLDEHKTHLKLSEHNTHLSKAYKDNPDRNQSIIELGQWNARYKALPGKQQEKMSASSLLDDHFKNLTTAVNSYLTQKKYPEALKEMDGLGQSTNSKVVSLYVGIHIAAGDFSAALEHCTKAMEYKGENVKMKEGYCEFYKSLAEQFKAANATAQASEAAKIAESYKPEVEHQKLMTLTKEQQTENKKLATELEKKRQEAEESARKYATTLKELEEIKAQQAILLKEQEMQAEQRAKLDEYAALLKVKQQNQSQATKEQINALTAQTSSSITQVKPSAPFELPPAYSSVTNTNKEQQGSYPFHMLGETIPTTSTGTGPVVTTKNTTSVGDSSVVTVNDSKDTKVTAIETIVTNAVPAEINDITTILHSEKPDINRVAVLCKRAIGKQSDLYKIIDDSVVLLNLTSAYLKLEKPMEAKEAVNKVVNDAIKNNKNAYDETEDSSVLNLIAEEYKEEGLLNKSVAACKKAVSQPGYTACAESYQLLKEIGETKNLKDKELALDALNVAKDNAADDIQKYHIHMTIIKMHLTSKNSEDAKKEYKELLNNVTYQTVLKLAKTPEEVKHLSAVDDELAKYKSLSDKYKANPTLDNAASFYRELWGINKCEIKLAGIMETNLRLHDPEPLKKIDEIIRNNPGNKIILRLNECYKGWYSKTEGNNPNDLSNSETYVKAIGDIDNCLFGGEW